MSIVYLHHISIRPMGSSRLTHPVGDVSGAYELTTYFQDQTTVNYFPDDTKCLVPSGNRRFSERFLSANKPNAECSITMSYDLNEYR